MTDAHRDELEAVEAEVLQRARSLRAEPDEILQRFDRNRDGELSRDEWRVARAALRREVIADRAMDGEGEILAGRYRTIVPLGLGSQGRTSLALDQETEHFVAVKELDFDQVEHWDAIELFERETRVLEQLDHPGIPSFVERFGTDDEGSPRFFLVCADVAGHTLAEAIESGDLQIEEDVRNIARKVLEVLAYLQSFTPPVLHRDITPENIVLGEDGQVSLVNFGSVAVRLESTVGGSTVVGADELIAQITQFLQAGRGRAHGNDAVLTGFEANELVEEHEEHEIGQSQSTWER